MNDNEKLIEETAQAIFEVGWKTHMTHWHESGHQYAYRERARAALAVFEKALGEATVTPTLGRSRGKHTDEQMLYMICLALEEGLEGVASIDIPDLIIKMISEHWGTADADTSPEEAEAALAQLAPYIPDHMRTPEPQGEPSEAQCRILPLQHRVQNPSHHGSAAQGEVQ